MENDIINTIKDGERVTSSYAEIYFDDIYCDGSKLSSIDENVTLQKKRSNDTSEANVWVSPSDLLIGKVELTPPFTSKITRGITHEGILAIGNELLTTERTQFLKSVNKLLEENESAWRHILSQEKASVAKKVRDIYRKIFNDKSKIMSKEMSIFYENALEELEKSLKTQVNNVLVCTHANIISKLNTDINEKLAKERKVLEDVLEKRYKSEVLKIKKYYKLLLDNELFRSNQMINKVLTERNDAFKAFIRQNEAENVTRTMYVMSTERKKCKIKQFVLENYQTLELKEKHQKIKEKQKVLDILKKQDRHISEINQEWENKIKKILQLFLKFISFSLKLLPEQTSFLLNFEKMMVLQMNEMQKMPNNVSSILIDADTLDNSFKFERMEEKEVVCTKEPYVIEGGYLSGTPSTSYGSTVTLPDHVDLPTVRVQRQFVYAKCHHYEDIKEMLEAKRCKCNDVLKVNQSSESTISVPEQVVKEIEVPIDIVSYEPLLIDDIQRLDECPVRNCQDWVNQSTFPNLESYLDFDDEKNRIVQSILGKLPKKSATPDIIDPKTIVLADLPFSPTKEQYHTVETQYSSQEDLYHPDVDCTCVSNYSAQKRVSHYRLKESTSKILNENMIKRKNSLRRMLQQNPNLLKMFTDESFDFIF